MQYRTLGTTGVRVSTLALGTALFGVAPTAESARDLLDLAADHGVNLVDTANSYGHQARFDRPGAPPSAERSPAEQIVGRALAGRRDRFVVCTKVGEPVGPGPNDGSLAGGGLTRLHIRAQVEASLRRLDTDHIDVYYAHRPDPLTRIEETVAAFGELISQGLIRYYALSNYAGWQLAEAVLVARSLGVPPPVCHQIRYCLSVRTPESEVLPAGEHLGVPTVAFGALGGGLFAGRARFRASVGKARWGGPAFGPGELALADRVDVLAAEWGLPSAHVALAWALGRAGVASLVVGPESTTELAELLPAVDVELDADQRALLDEASGRGGAAVR